jgi:hypothetical protein
MQDGNTNIVCGQPGSIQMLLVGPAVCALLIYVIGIPVFVFFFLRGKRERIKYTQILRAKGLHQERLVHRYFVWARMWQRLFYFYVPGKWYWLCIILGRKLLIAFTSLMFRSNPSFQLAMSLLVLFVAYVLQGEGH